MMLNKGNILIVDDILESLKLLFDALTERGYKVRGSAKGLMAIRAAKLAPPDLILLDIKMPDLDGYQVCEQLKADEATREIPVIFISALDEAIDKVKAFKVGGVDYITKPFYLEEVLARVENQLTIQKLQKELKLQNIKLQQEIQERRKAEEEAQAASLAKSQFLANVSHELRTPLNAILGFTQVLNRESNLQEDQQEYLKIIQRSGEHLLDLIDDVLDLSKIEAGLVLLNEKSFDLYRLLDNIEELFEMKAKSKQLALKLRIASEVPQYIFSDEQKLRGCLINLLGNAIKFTTEGHVTLTVNLQPAEDEELDSYLVFEVIDTGPGIAPEEIETLFNAFVQTSTGITSAEGTGLGLAITKRFVELMGGEITVESNFKEGSRFRFTIGLKQGNSAESLEQIIPRVVGLESQPRAYRILVVDDTAENRILLGRLLKPIGFEVREASNGWEGILAWQEWQPDLILMDTRMPVLGGIEATKRIRNQEKQRMPNLRPTTIIALTASAFEERRGEIIEAGSDDFVRKPFTEEIIFGKLSQYLGVRYVYEEVSPIAAERNWQRQAIAQRPESFWEAQFTGLAVEWLQQLREAANQVNEKLVSDAIAELPPEKNELAEALRELVADFRLDVILRITEFLEQH
ncbi:response regulator [Oscillatoria sp. FACHB-1406]|uniref:response regulator n=1 Tax=Oscillatoria sp. FACHB-1406 TaxID=2692846 RepID=UPI0016892946|nr:response regulator [Oscillatoria sp. FACHB-1406]MBD2576654.1 response regulator [Oscillatoria sp. FACHB-1406]